jgi:hypothetical protein
MVIEPRWLGVLIHCTIEDINYYAGEIGFFKSLSETQENEAIRQWFMFFITYSETEMENANDRLKKHRQELIDWELQNTDH